MSFAAEDRDREPRHVTDDLPRSCDYYEYHDPQRGEERGCLMDKYRCATQYIEATSDVFEEVPR